jgi:predicted HTH transcriptional regulator
MSKKRQKRRSPRLLTPEGDSMVFASALYRQWNRVSRAMAQRDLGDLVSRGILVQQGVGRETYYVLAGSDEAQMALDEA